MTTIDHPPRGGAGGRDDRSQRRERERRAHLRSADGCEEHALLLDRFGAHQAANIERHNAKLEREAAESARRQ
jgi:hypothetical protein